MYEKCCIYFIICFYISTLKSKKKVDEVPSILKESVSKTEAEEIIKQLKEVGGVVEMV